MKWNALFFFNILDERFDLFKIGGWSVYDELKGICDHRYARGRNLRERGGNLRRERGAESKDFRRRLRAVVGER